MSAVELRLGRYQEAVQRRLRAWSGESVAARLWERDHALWSAQAVPELADRLGWLELPETMSSRVDDMTALAEGVREAGTERVLLLGMGGSSLAPELFQRTFGNRRAWPSLEVVDSTHPDNVTAVTSSLDPRRTLLVVSSKSGGTIETLSLFRHFWQVMGAAIDRPGEHFVAITDPGSSLETLGHERDFRTVVTSPPDVGGRYSALSPFGLVPAALIGLDPARLLRSGRQMAAACMSQTDNPGLELGAAVGELALAGRDKLTFVTSPALAALPDWIEQLVAESTGKDGAGIVPVVGEALAGPEAYGDDRVFVLLALAAEADESVAAAMARLSEQGHPTIRIVLDDAWELGGELFRWEVATAAAAIVLAIHPFNQPDVQLAKKLAQQAMAGAEDTARAPAGLPVQELPSWLEGIGPGDYVAIQAFIAPTPETAAALASLQRLIRGRTLAPTTIGFGPRFLHSTGQLHKGGPATGWFLQLVDRPVTEVPVAETDYSFARLIAAQARGDVAALEQRGRRVRRVELEGEEGVGLAQLIEVFEG